MTDVVKGRTSARHSPYSRQIRIRLGLEPYEPTTDAKRRAAHLGINTEYELPKNNGQTTRRYNNLRIQTLFFHEDLNRKLGRLGGGHLSAFYRHENKRT